MHTMLVFSANSNRNGMVAVNMVRAQNLNSAYQGVAVKPKCATFIDFSVNVPLHFSLFVN
jgi:hypothetical protein